ncbi:uncharacterized protein METZ01_LOCUS328484, partial [marine metagenome]
MRCVLAAQQILLSKLFYQLPECLTPVTQAVFLLWLEFRRR